MLNGDFVPTSSTWVYVRSYANTRLDLMRLKLEDETIDGRSAQVIRGQIKELKLLLLLDKVEPRISEGNDYV